MLLHSIIAVLSFLSLAAALVPTPSVHRTADAEQRGILTSTVKRTTTVCTTTLSSTASASSSIESWPPYHSQGPEPNGTVLSPCNPDMDRDDLHNLDPQKNITLYYEEPGDGTNAAFVSVTSLTQPAVVLEHSSYITNIGCGSGKLTITFDDQKALQYALASWNAFPSKGFVLITHSASCGLETPSERAWLLVLRVSQSGSTIVVEYIEVPASDVIGTVTITFGQTGNGGNGGGSKPSGGHSGGSGPHSTVSSQTHRGSSTSSSSRSSSKTTSKSSSKSSSSKSSGSSSSSSSKTTSKSSTTTTSTTSRVSQTIQPTSFSNIADFDVDLDDSIGYLDPTWSGFWPQLLPGIPAQDIPGLGSPSKRRFLKRDFDDSSIASFLVDSAQSVLAVDSAALSVVTAAYQVASDAVGGALTTAINTAVSVLNSLSPFSLGPFPFNYGPNSTVSTPFGNGYELDQKSGTYKGVAGTATLYCIGCGLTGSFTLTGTVVFDSQQGITQAVFDVNGNMQAQVEFAIIATATYSNSIEKNVFTQGLPALTVPGFLVLGPAVSIDAGATIDVEAEGGLAAGYNLNWPTITAHFDIINDDYSATGLVPVESPIFDVEANITVASTAYALLSLTFGIDILKGKYKANVGLVDKPEVDSLATYNHYSEMQAAALPEGLVVCEGVNLTVGLKDSVYADVAYAGLKGKSSTKTYDLTSFDGPTTTTCIGSLSTIHHSTNSSSSSSSTTSTTTTSMPPTTTTAKPSTVIVAQPTATVSGIPCDAYAYTIGYCCQYDANNTRGYYNCLDVADAYIDLVYAAEVDCRSNTTNNDDWIQCVTDYMNDQLQSRTDNARCGIFDDGIPADELEYQGCLNDIAQFGIVTQFTIASLPKGGITEYGLPAPRSLGIEDSTIHYTSDSSLSVAWQDDGNLVFSSTANDFASLGGSIFGDSNNRFLHMYSDTMESQGVSRLRLAALTLMPLPSVLM
jgi:hypothetical protein